MKPERPPMLLVDIAMCVGDDETFDWNSKCKQLVSESLMCVFKHFIHISRRQNMIQVMR
jgi:hypothetical protein